MSAPTSPSDRILIRPMEPSDIAAGMRLKRIAGWNQTRHDWCRFLSLEPHGCFVAEVDGATVGTLTYCLFRPIAWLGMMLVDPQFRRRGVATRLMSCILTRLDAEGISSVRLDATDMARPLYEKLGFRPQMRMLRYGSSTLCRNRTPLPLTVRGFHWSQWHQLLQLDMATVRVDRTKLLKRLLMEQDGSGRVISIDGQLAGYLIDRSGALAVQIGPMVVTNDMVGRCLLTDALHRHHRRRVYVDVPAANQAARAALEESGLTVCREFTRMYRGQPWQEAVASLWAGSGPEKG